MSSPDQPQDDVSPSQSRTLLLIVILTVVFALLTFYLTGALGIKHGNGADALSVLAAAILAGIAASIAKRLTPFFG